MRKFVWIVAPFFLVALPAAAEIFKCEIDSLGSLPSAPTAAAPVPAQGANTQKPKIVATAVNRGSEASSGAVRVGMTSAQVRAVWGEPTETYQDELVEGRVEIWAYGSNRTVKFDLDGHVTEIQP